jgi:hypothetical protein
MSRLDVVFDAEDIEDVQLFLDDARLREGIECSNPMINARASIIAWMTVHKHANGGPEVELSAQGVADILHWFSALDPLPGAVDDMARQRAECGRNRIYDWLERQVLRVAEEVREAVDPLD